MVDQLEPFVASLIRRGETEPYEFEVLPSNNWDEAERLARKWARETHSIGGVLYPCSLHLKQGAKGKFLDEWTDC